jgi:hypothetical protein
MIDALETIIKWLAAGLPSAGGRVANKHRYSDGWTKGQVAVSVHPDDMGSELYGKLHLARVEVRLYGTPMQIGDLHNEIDALCRGSNRAHVSTSQGTALMQFCQIASGLSTVYDDDLHQDVGIVYLFAMISQQAVPTT